MQSKKSASVKLIKLTKPFNQAHLFRMLSTVIQHDQHDIKIFTAQHVKSLIMTREREGETYIGYGVVLLHVISEAVDFPEVLLVQSSVPLHWQSTCSGEDHTVDKFVVLIVSPSDQDNIKFRPVMHRLTDEKSINQLFKME